MKDAELRDMYIVAQDKEYAVCQDQRAAHMAGLRAVFEAGARAQWIPVSNRVPIDGVSVLVYEPGRAIEKTTYYHKDWILPHKSNVTHWMPLPKEPK